MTAGATSERRTGWTSARRICAFWATAALGVLPAGGSWMWLYLASDEDARGTAHDRSWPNAAVLSLGGIPLLIAHVVGLVVLVTLAARARRSMGSAAALGVIVLLGDSLIGLGLSLLLTGGQVVVTPQPFQP
ncbi:hypothetical protein NYS50_15185 [Curtobacterium flaccumfaciens pv. flaccumfaciens]|uniref:hypothetical protein n=1 Tax=Curtobacterium flaccumfaciens TaxID=2035 RepID=UPI00217DB791|nr:hypothetical protein [Curtobacterium flaccumfaciens]MCS6549224.1 hypothetical protein [Curtobacterium flaccumfaciens pv. flaccumfaciens]